MVLVTIVSPQPSPVAAPQPQSEAALAQPQSELAGAPHPQSAMADPTVSSIAAAAIPK
jgi:hypothetical protein